MLKRLTRKLFILFMLCAALTVVSSSSASTTKPQPKGYCVEVPICAYDCCSGYYCCDNYGNCYCG